MVVQQILFVSYYICVVAVTALFLFSILTLTVCQATSLVCLVDHFPFLSLSVSFFTNIYSLITLSYSPTSLDDFDSITQQVFGFKKAMNETAPVKMNGFYANAVPIGKSFVMSAFNTSNLPVLSTLATEFALFDSWYVSIPTCTNPNREMAMSGTSNGYVTNTIPDVGFPQMTHFKFLEQYNISWKIHYEDDQWMAPCFADLREPSRVARTQELSYFFQDIAQGTLSNYTWLQPRMATSKNGPSNWQHPDASVEAGEQLLSDVYSALRSSQYWEESALIITFDEHGGFGDHKHTPTEGIPSPDGIIADNGFDFSRLGVRVPTVVVSPWIERNSVIHEPTGSQLTTPTSHFEGTSTLATANRIFGIDANLTNRDSWTARFDNIFNGKLRKDCPMTMPAVRPIAAETLAKEMLFPLNDHHFGSLNLLCYLTDNLHSVCKDFSDKKAQNDFVSSLGEKTISEDEWSLASEFPHLLPAAAMRLKQQHFELCSKPMTVAWRSKVLGSA
jgi:hypothetical protein